MSLADPFIPLHYPTQIRHPADVARLRKILNERGFDASDGDIQWAYEDWNEDVWATCLSPDRASDDLLFDVLRDRLKAEGED